MSSPPPPEDMPTRITGGPVERAPQGARLKQACLIQYSGSAMGRRHTLPDGMLVIGRGQNSGVTLLDDSVSREHARCEVAGDSVTLEDLGSSNGTFINNQRIREKTPLGNGDIVRLGGVQLKYFARDSIENVFHDEIYRKATIDVGTQIFNKQYLLETLEAGFAHSRAQQRPLSVIYFDLDFFKKVNDTHGHSCGDFILRECAQLAKSCLRKDDVIGRYGGEEFVVVLPGCDLQIAAAFAERIRKTLEQHAFAYEGKTLRQTVSLGVAENTPAFKDYKDLLDDADRKLYQSKHGGRNRITF
jgi:diguanylate cyclase (GGDEF)-like protein